MQLPTPSSATTVCRLPRPVMFVPRAVMCNPSSNSPLVVISGWQSCQTEVSVGVSGSCRSIHQTLLLLVRIRFHKVSLSLRVFVVSAAVTGAELCCLGRELLDSWALTPSQVSCHMQAQLLLLSMSLTCNLTGRNACLDLCDLSVRSPLCSPEGLGVASA